MAEIKQRLADTCRDHGIGDDMIEASRDLGELLDRALARCQRLLDAERPEPEQLRGLVQLARQVREAQSQGAVLDELGQHVDNAVQLDQDTQRVTVSVDIGLLGELFGSLARLCHKINNPLTSVMGRAQMLQMKVKQSDAHEQLGKSVQVIEDSTKRVAALVQELANLVCQGRKEFVEHYDSSNGSL